MMEVNMVDQRDVTIKGYHHVTGYVRHKASSDASSQSWPWSQRNIRGMHSPLSHVNSVVSLHLFGSVGKRSEFTVISLDVFFFLGQT